MCVCASVLYLNIGCILTCVPGPILVRVVVSVLVVFVGHSLVAISWYVKSVQGMGDCVCDPSLDAVMSCSSCVDTSVGELLLVALLPHVAIFAL